MENAIGIGLLVFAVILALDGGKVLSVARAAAASTGGSAGSSFTGGAVSGPGVLTPTQLRAYAQQAGFSGNALNTILKIIGAESGGCASIYNGGQCNGPAPAGSSGAFGLTQIHPVNWAKLGQMLGLGRPLTPQDLADPLVNLKAAYALSNGGSDWGPWTASRSVWGG